MTVSVVAEVVTAVATSAAAIGVLYPYWRNRAKPRVAYAFDVDLRNKHIPGSPFGVQLDAPEVKRFVLKVTNPRMVPLVVTSIYFQARRSERGDRSFVTAGGHEILAPGETRRFFLRMEEDLIPPRERCFLVIEGVGWTRIIDPLEKSLGDIGIRLLPDTPVLEHN